MVTNSDRARPDSTGWTHAGAVIGDLTMHHVREGRGMPLFLLHGWPEFWWSYHRNIPVLAEHFDVVAPDFRGFGDSRLDPATAAAPAGADRHAADIVALADMLGFERFGIVSHDVGAFVAQHIARTAPGRLTGLFFFNVPYPGIGRRWVDADQVREIWYQSFNQQPWAASLVGQSRETCRIYFEAMLRHWAHDQDALDGQIEIFVDNFMKPGNIEGGFAWYRATHAARMALVRDGAPDLPRIAVPTRVYWGRHDPIIRVEWRDRLGDYFQDPVVEIAEGAGHFVHLETPAAANARIIDFFRSL